MAKAQAYLKAMGLVQLQLSISYSYKAKK